MQSPTTRIAFTKMQGLGNDFLVLRGEGTAPPSAALIRRLADRRRGIGFDQLLWVEPPHAAGEDAWYRIFNADGGEAEQCGNGARCIARLVADSGQERVRLGFPGGTVRARLESDGNVTVEMAVPEFAPARVPFVAAREAGSYDIEAGDQRLEIGVVSMGNPHGVLVVDDVATAPVERLGPLLERHERFPNRANIGFLQILAPDRVRLRVFERGAGETQGCGTGACAAVVIGRSRGLLGPDVTVELPGGSLAIHWQGPGEPVWMTGEAVTVFEGTIEV